MSNHAPQHATRPVRRLPPQHETTASETPAPAALIPLAGLAADHGSVHAGERRPAEPTERLQVGSADDAAEQRAERAAGDAMARLRGLEADPSTHDERQCADLATLRRWHEPAASPEVGAEGGPLAAGTERMLQASRGRGEPMPDPLRGRLESAFGASLSGVRLHSGSEAAQMSRRLGAAAFTMGHDVYFRDGMPDTSTQEGVHVLAHEVAHALEAGGAAQPEPLRRWLLIDNVRYKAEHRADVEQLQNIPAGWQERLDRDGYWYPNANRDGWLKDTTFEMKNFGQGTQTKPMLKMMDDDPLAVAPASKGELTKVGKTPMATTKAGLSEQRRVLPKNPQTRLVSAFRLYKKSHDDGGATHKNSAHWELECDATGGKTKDKTIKIDLINGSYRILYNSVPIPPDKIRQQDQAAHATLYETPSTFTLDAAVSVQTVYETVLKVARQLGAWEGNPGINCQDFALALLKEFTLAADDAQRLDVEDDWRQSVRDL